MQKLENTKHTTTPTGYKLSLSPIITKRLKSALDIQDPKETIDSLEHMDKTINKTISIIAHYLKKHPKSANAIFLEMCNFFNQLFTTCCLKKFYNSAPITPIDRYAESAISDQLSNNIYIKSNINSLKRNDTSGASCHYRSVLMKNCFDRLQEVGLPINSYIFMYNEKTNRHSGVIIKFKKEAYFVDTTGINKIMKKLILPINKKLVPYPKSVREEIQYLTQKDTQKGSIKYFDSIPDFIRVVKVKQNLKIQINFKSPFPEDNNATIKIIFTPTYLIMQKDQEKEEIAYQKNNKNEKNKKNENISLLSIFEKNYTSTPEKKTNRKKYITLINKKVDPRRVTRIFSYLPGYKNPKE